MPKQHTPDLAKASVSSLKVLADDNAGAMINKRNSDWELGGHGHDPKVWKLGQIMSDEVVFCYEDEECERAQRLMEEHGMNYLAVVDREMRVVGIFCREEIRALSQAAGAADTSP